MAKTSSSIPGKMPETFWQTQAARITNEITLPMNIVLGLVYPLFIRHVVTKVSPTRAQVFAQYNLVAIPLNCFLRLKACAYFGKQKDILNIAFQISAFSALFFRNGVWISSGIDLLALSINYLRYLPPKKPAT